MHLKIRHKGIILVAVPLVFELAIVGALTYSLHRADQAIGLVRHSERILTELSTFDNAFEKLFSSGAMYMLTRSEKQYNTFGELRRQEQEALAKLRELIGNDERQQENLKNLESAMKEVNDRIDQAVETVHSESGFRGLMEMAGVGSRRRDLRFTQDFFSATAAIAAVEHERSQHYSVREGKARQLVYTSLVVAVVGNIVVCIALAIFFSRDVTFRLSTIMDNTFRLRARRSLQPLLSGDDEIAYLDKAFHEMSAEIEATEDKRRQLDALKREFANMVNHDMRSPLQALRGFLENAADGVYGKMSAEGQSLSESLIGSLGLLLKLVNSLLEVDQLEDAGVKLDLQPHSVRQIIEHVTAPLQLLAQTKQVVLNVSGGPDDLQVIADDDRVVQVLQNLVSNAIAYSPSSGSVELTYQQIAGFVEFRIRDNGPGIAEADQEQIFERFKRGESAAATKVQGYGLGLAICKTIVDRHHGIIGVESQPGKGSTFWFKIPAVDCPADSSNSIAIGESCSSMPEDQRS
jgi:signal transduction histidine kinase